MKLKNRTRLMVSLTLFAAFALWTFLLGVVDVAAIGPRGSSVGFSTLNGAFHRLTGVCMPLYTVTDWLGLVPVAIGFGFALLGLWQWIRRKQLFKVDYSLFVLGGFYIVMLACYLAFESVVINYRPTLINNFLEVSYPSSTTLLTLCVMPTAIHQWHRRLHSHIVTVLATLFTAFMVIGRLLSGVHWLTDIIGGTLLSAALVTLYLFFVYQKQ